ncbi:HAD hydrolase-like protein [Aneurinibacillus migulanus]|uniref:HAD family hydrolase n=1 Tax=Aneurinibacillus migulanus TaxID=47500 RepID=UPI002E1F5A0D|nr:HAD hydrolase-like protein [Aneurinibacillus migulanus]
MNELWRRDRYLSLEYNYLVEKKIISLDVFDTVLFRFFHSPTDLFLKVGELAIKEKYVRSGLTPTEFQQIRILAERKARSNMKKLEGHNEVNLEQIYACIPVSIGDVEKLMEIEFEMEKQYCYLNPSMMSLISDCKARGIRICLLSDMYLSSAQIKEILISNKFPEEWLDLLLVSNEAGGDKASGILFEKLLSIYPDVTKEQIVHIGDNKNADIEGAQRVGIRAIHYDVVPANLDSLFEWERIRHGEFLPEIVSLRKLAYSMTAGMNSEDTFWFRYGAVVLGPFLTLFSDWVLEQCVREGKNKIYPLMREGALLSTLLQESALESEVSCDIKPIYVSRQATYFPSIETFDKEQLGNMFEKKNFTVGHLLEMFSLEGDDTLRKYWKTKLTACKDIMIMPDQSLRQYIISFFEQSDVVEYLSVFLNQKRELFVEYIQQECDFSSKIVTVDFGFKGTIQKYMESALSIAGIKVDMTHLLAIGAEATKDCLIKGMDVRGWMGSAGENNNIIKTFMRSPEVFEELIMANCGSTVGYEHDRNHKVIPVLGVNIYNEKEWRKREICQQGILLFQKLWFYLKKKKPFVYEQLLKRKQEWGMSLHRALDMPMYEEVTKLGSLSHSDNFGSTDVFCLCKDEERQLLRNIGIDSFLSRTRRGYHDLPIYWPQGILTQEDPSYLFKKYLYESEAFSYLAIMNDMVSEIKQKGFLDIIVYGAGEVGSAMMKISNIHHVNVQGIVDRKQSLWGSIIDGVEIISLDEAIAKGIHVYAVASLAFAKEIEKDIEERYSKYDIKPVIFTSVSS